MIVEWLRSTTDVILVCSLVCRQLPEQAAGVVSSPGHSQILSRSHDFSPWLRDKIWEWPVDEATAGVHQIQVLHHVRHHVWST